jgi:hypothetical protein
MNKLKILRNVVLTENCLLHGSPKKIEEIRLHYTDGEMAICATPYPEIAVFMAVVNACRPGNSGILMTIHQKKYFVKFTLCERMLSVLLRNDVRGYVYALDAESFKSKTPPFEYRAYESLYSTRVLSVGKEHLPFMPMEGQTTYNVLLNPIFAHPFN